MNVDDNVTITHGPWEGFTGRITALFTGSWVAVQLRGYERTFPADQVAPAHNVVTTIDGQVARHYCTFCSATSHGIHQPAPPCPGGPE